MRIVFDCRSVFPGMGGIGRYAQCLARELASLVSPDDELLLLTGARRPSEPIAPRVREVPVDAALIDPEFEQIALPGILEELEADLYHNPCFSVPIAASRVKRVATVHDVVFRRRPELVPEGLRAYLDRWTEVSCEVADAIVTVSDFSKGEIAALYDRSDTHVVPNAVEPRFFKVRRRPEGTYVLYVGALEEKKNVPALLQGFAELIRTRPDLRHELRLAGGLAAGPYAVEEVIAQHPELEGRVAVLGHVPEDALLELYAGADAFAYLSEYEGFGLPPLEAMAAGVPTVVADRASLPEVTENAALVVDPASPRAVAGALERLLTDDALRRDLEKRGPAAARRFDWKASARALLDLYRSLSTPTLRVLAGGAA